MAWAIKDLEVARTQSEALTGMYDSKLWRVRGQELLDARAAWQEARAA